MGEVTNLDYIENVLQSRSINSPDNALFVNSPTWFNFSNYYKKQQFKLHQTLWEVYFESKTKKNKTVVLQWTALREVIHEIWEKLVFAAVYRSLVGEKIKTLILRS